MRRLAVAVLLGAALLLQSCDEGAESKELVLIGGPSSLQDLVMATASAFEKAHPDAHLEFSFEASSTLAQKVHEGAPIDVFISADLPTIDRVRGDLDPSSIAPILSNQLALVVREGMASRPSSPRDLVGQSGMLALAAPEVPAGRYARAYLEKTGLLASLTHRIVNAENVRAALALVQSGAADWGIVYRSDALNAKRVAIAWIATGADDVGATYYAAVVSRSKARNARPFVTWMRSEAFQSAAETHGFLKLP